MKHKIASPMAGTIFTINVKPGDSFDYGDTVAVLESMKMEIAVEANGAGVVREVLVAVGDAVDQDAAILTYE